MEKHFIRGILLFYLLLLFFSCATLPSSTTQKIADKRVEFVATGVGSPTVIFETGMGPTMRTWAPVFKDISQISTALAYNRPGYGSSSYYHAPTTVQGMAKELHDNLLHLGYHPPYLLVGHSVGGLFMNMFARLYPEDVAGALFIDATHPEQFEYFKNKKSLMYSMLVGSSAKGARGYESNIVKSAYYEFQEAPPFPEIPIKVLTAEKSFLLEGKKMREQWNHWQDDLAGLSAQSNHFIVEGSNHNIHENNPEIVIAEIREMIYAIRENHDSQITKNK